MMRRDAFVLALVALFCLHGTFWFPLIEGATRQRSAGLLFGEFLPLSDIYDAQAGDALLVPGMPLQPPPPADNAPRIGVVDSGVSAAHPQLRPLVVAQKAFAGSDATDRLGHGTMVALQLLHGFQQTIGDYGSTYPAIVSARVTDDAHDIGVDSVIAAIDWVVEQGAQTVNLSLGFRGPATSYENLCNAIAKHVGVTFVAAAGNFGPDVTVFPAACPVPNVISVGSVGDDGMPSPSSGVGDIFAPAGR